MTKIEPNQHVVRVAERIALTIHGKPSYLKSDDGSCLVWDGKNSTAIWVDFRRGVICEPYAENVNREAVNAMLAKAGYREAKWAELGSRGNV
jgi:hypothetical protein